MRVTGYQRPIITNDLLFNNLTITIICFASLILIISALLSAIFVGFVDSDLSADYELTINWS